VKTCVHSYQTKIQYRRNQSHLFFLQQISIKTQCLMMKNLAYFSFQTFPFETWSSLDSGSLRGRHPMVVFESEMVLEIADPRERGRQSSLCWSTRTRLWLLKGNLFVCFFLERYSGERRLQWFVTVFCLWVLRNKKIACYL